MVVARKVSCELLFGVVSRESSFYFFKHW